MSIIKSFTRNDYGCSVVFTDDPTEKSYYVSFNDKVLIADEVVGLFIAQLHGKAAFAIFSESAFRNELEAKLSEPYEVGVDPKLLDLADGDCVVTIDGLSEQEVLALALRAHREDITLNQLFINVLKSHIDKVKPE